MNDDRDQMEDDDLLLLSEIEDILFYEANMELLELDDDELEFDGFDCLDGWEDDDEA